MNGKKPVATYVWPGLPQLWMRGSWPALGVAVAGAIVLDLALLGSLVWSELFPIEVLIGLWLAAGAIWIGGTVLSNLMPLPSATDERPRTTDTYPLAVQNYLRGNWIEAERLLTAALRRDVRDLECRLLLVTLLRRSDRLDEAEGQLDTLERFDGVEKWVPELQRERKLILEADENLQAAEDRPGEIDSTTSNENSTGEDDASVRPAA